eukprot:44730-Eustigmatos_ZCMA.PRE.1
METFGGFSRFWRFLLLTHSLERDTHQTHTKPQATHRVSPSSLLLKLQESLQHGDATPQSSTFVRQLLENALCELKSACDGGDGGGCVGWDVSSSGQHGDSRKTVGDICV